MRPHELAAAIKELCPDAEFTFQEVDLDTLTWLVEPKTIPSNAEILAKVAELQKAEIEFEKNAQAKKQALLDRLGITADEARLLLS